MEFVQAHLVLVMVAAGFVVGLVVFWVMKLTGNTKEYVSPSRTRVATVATIRKSNVEVGEPEEGMSQAMYGMGIASDTPSNLGSATYIALNDES